MSEEQTIENRLTPEQLMQKRYKVIADYPNSGMDVGAVIPFKDWPELSPYQIIFYNKYPNIYRELHWWENREQKDMPDYVKTKNGVIWKVTGWDLREKWCNAEDAYTPIYLELCLPATETDYTQYINRWK